MQGVGWLAAIVTGGFAGWIAASVMKTGTGLINGISAMPSMHVGTSVLFAILGFSAGKKWLGYLMSVFAFLIFIGSIHLGWHYAIDGYAGAAIAVACWWISGKIVAWDRRKRGVAET